MDFNPKKFMKNQTCFPEWKKNSATLIGVPLRRLIRRLLSVNKAGEMKTTVSYKLSRGEGQVKNNTL